MNGDTDLVGYEQPEDLLQNLLVASQAAQTLQQRGVRAVPRPTDLPALNVGSLLRLNPVAAANLIRGRRAQEQRNLADEENAQQLLRLALQEQQNRATFSRSQKEYERRKAEAKGEKLAERENAAAEFADLWADAIAKNREASQSRDSAAKALADINKFARTQTTAGNVLSGQPIGKPNPKEGVHVVPFSFNIPTQDPITGKPFPEQGIKARNEVASILNTEFEKRTKAFNDAMELWRTRTQETQDLLKRTRPAGFYVAPDSTKLVDIQTRKTYSLPAQNKRYKYDPSSGKLQPY